MRRYFPCRPTAVTRECLNNAVSPVGTGDRRWAQRSTTSQISLPHNRSSNRLRTVSTSGNSGIDTSPQRSCLRSTPDQCLVLDHQVVGQHLHVLGRVLYLIPFSLHSGTEIPI